MEDDTESLSPPILRRLDELSDVEESFEDPPDLGRIQELITFDEKPESKLDGLETVFASGDADIGLREARGKLTKTTDFKQIKGWQQKFGHLLNRPSPPQQSIVQIEEKVKEVQETYSNSMPSVYPTSSIIVENVQISSILAAKETEEIPSMDMTLFCDSYDHEIILREEQYEADYDVPENVEMPTAECGEQFCRLGCVCDSLKTVINRPKISLEHSKINWPGMRRRRERKVPGRYFSSNQIVFSPPSGYSSMNKESNDSHGCNFLRSQHLVRTLMSPIARKKGKINHDLTSHQCLPLQSCLIPISLTNYSSHPADESSVKVNNTKESEPSAESSDEIIYMDAISFSSDDDEIAVVATVVKSVSPEIEIVYDRTSCFSHSLTTVNLSENGSEKTKENTDAAECFIKNSGDSEDEIDVCGLSQEESSNSTSSVTEKMEKRYQTEKTASKSKQSRNNYSCSIPKRSAQQLLRSQQEKERRGLLSKRVQDLDSLLVPNSGSRRGQIAILNHATSTIKSLQSEAEEMEDTYRELKGRRTNLLETRERRFYGLPTVVRQMFNCQTDSLVLPIRHLEVSEAPS